MEAQKQIVLPPNPTGSLKRVPPDVPSRHGSAVVAPHRAPPPVPSRPSPKSTDDQRKPNVVGKTDQRTRTKAVTDEIESNDLEVEAKKPDSAKFKVDQGQTTESEIQVFFDPAKLEQSTVEVKDTVVQRPRHKPPPLPPRPTSSSFHEEPENTEARSVETQTSPRSPNSTQLNNKDSKIAASTEKLSEKPPIPEASDKPQLKPKPKPKPRPRPRMAAGPDKKDEVYSAVPQPRPVMPATDEEDEAYSAVPEPRPVMPAASDEEDEAYSFVPPPRPVVRGSPGGTRTHGETSRSEMETNMTREESKPLNVKRTEPRVSQNEGEEDSNLKPSPVPAPRIKRASHSLGEMVERKLHIEHIDLTQQPYTDSVSWRLVS